MIKVSLKPYFTPQTFCFQESNQTMLADLFCFQMNHKASLRNGVLMVSLDSLKMILSPQITILQQEELIHFKEDTTILFSCPPVIEETVIYVPVVEILVQGLGWHIKTGSYQGQGIYQISKNEDARFDIFTINYLLHQKNGILKRVCYLEEAGQLCPYRLFVPTSYNPEQSWKLAVILHGLNGDDVFEKGNHKLAHLGEQYHYLILAPIAYTRGMHGSVYPMARDFIDPATADPANPAGLTDEEKRIYRLCEAADMTALSEVMQEYAVDENNIFLGGNSMGSDGAYYLGTKYPQLFRAIAPCAGGPDFRYFPVENLKHTPIRVLCGTEDPGYHLVNAMYHTLLEKGFHAEISRVAGEPHGEAWIYDLEGMFQFFNKNDGGNCHE